MKKKFTNEAKIGVITIVGIALLIIGINYLKGINLFQSANKYYINFDNVDDVTISSPVFVDGFKVGLVRSLTYDYSNNTGIRVEISLDDNMRINKNSYAVIEKNLLGGAKLHLRLNKHTSEYMKTGESMEGRMSTDMMASVQNDLLPTFNNLMATLPPVLILGNTLCVCVFHDACSKYSFTRISVIEILNERSKPARSAKVGRFLGRT